MDFKIEYSGMINGIAVAESRKYFVIEANGRTWLYSDDENAGDFIYVSAHEKENQPGYGGFRGFGGRVITFDIVNGETIQLEGPWHTNSQSLYEATGLDLRKKHLSFVVIGEKFDKSSDPLCPWIREVIHIDQEPVVGEFNRGSILAREIANELNISVALYAKSQGGSLRCTIFPEKEKDKQ